jgi:hypothetical protein
VPEHPIPDSVRCWVAFCVVVPASTGGRAFAQEPRVEVLELGTARGEPGEIVKVPAFATITHAVCAYVVAFSYDPSRLAHPAFGGRPPPQAGQSEDTLAGRSRSL